MIKPLTSEYLLATDRGTGIRNAWLPRVLTQVFLTSQIDGQISLSPNPVTMIQGDLSWFNNGGTSQWVQVAIHRASRSFTTSSHVTVLIKDAHSFQVSESPSAPRPSYSREAFGGKFSINPGGYLPDQLEYSRYFKFGDDSQDWVDLGEVKALESFHFRYLAGVQTPGPLTQPSKWKPRYEAYAHWTRLIAVARPIQAPTDPQPGQP